MQRPHSATVEPMDSTSPDSAPTVGRRRKNILTNGVAIVTTDNRPMVNGAVILFNQDTLPQTLFGGMSPVKCRQ